MKFGLFDHLDHSNGPLHRQYANRLQFAERCDAAGFHAYHVAEHHVTPLGLAPSPLLYLSAVAQRTRNLRIGPLVLPLPLYNPLRLYEEICMVDQLSGGRLELGVGKGISPYEIGALGGDVRRAEAQFHETLRLLELAFAQEELSFKGEFFSTDALPLPLKPVQQPHPPLWYGVLKTSSAEWAGQQGMHVVCGAGPVEEVRDTIAAYHGAFQGNASGTAGLLRQLVIADSEAEARRRAIPAFRVFHENFTYLWNHFGDPLANQLLPDDMDQIIAHGEAIVGTPEQVIERLARELEISGANYLVCRFAFGSLAPEEVNQSMDLFCEHVMPALEKIHEPQAEAPAR